MSLLGDILSNLFERRYAAGEASTDRSVEDLCTALLSSQGEVSGVAIARQILDRYAAKDMKGRIDFFRHLAERMDVDPEAVVQAATAVREDKSAAAYARLMKASEPARQEFARRLNQVPGATAQLVKMRQDLLSVMREHPDLARIDLDFRHLFSSWFNRGFLVLLPISWQSPAHILEKIIAYEAVHAIDSWHDLRRRVEPKDRRCFAFFHPAMPDEPLIFVEVALTRGVPTSIHSVLAEERELVAPADADTAVFYSISNCQDGLAGISFGNSLIKQVVADLSRELPHLKTFVTLSPIPGLTRWMRETGTAPDLLEAAQSGDVASRAEDLRAVAAHYLLEARHARGGPYDPVARFHLTNGALVHELHAGADMSANGLRQSGGVMVNYLYDLARIETNHEGLATKGKIAASRAVTALARTALAKTALPGDAAAKPKERLSDVQRSV